MQNFYLWGKNNNSDIIELEKYIFNSGDILTYDKMEGILKHNSLLPNSLFSYLSLQNNSNIAQRLSKDGLLITNTSQTEYNIPNGQLGYFNNTEQFLLYKNNKWITLESQIPKILYAKVFYEDVLSNFQLIKKRKNTPIGIVLFGGGGGGGRQLDETNGPGGGGGGYIFYKYFSADEAEKIAFFSSLKIGEGGDIEKAGQPTILSYTNTKNETITITALGGEAGSSSGKGGNGGSGGGGGGGNSITQIPNGGDGYFGGGGGSGCNIIKSLEEPLGGHSYNYSLVNNYFLIGGGGGAACTNSIGGSSYINNIGYQTGGNQKSNGSGISQSLLNSNQFSTNTLIKTDEEQGEIFKLILTNLSSGGNGQTNGGGGGGGGFGSKGGAAGCNPPSEKFDGEFITEGSGSGGGGGIGDAATGGNGGNPFALAEDKIISTTGHGGGGGGGGGFNAKGGDAYNHCGGGGGGFGYIGQGGGYSTNGEYINAGVAAGAAGVSSEHYERAIADNATEIEKKIGKGGNGLCIIFYYE